MFERPLLFYGGARWTTALKISCSSCCDREDLRLGFAAGRKLHAFALYLHEMVTPEEPAGVAVLPKSGV